MKEDFLPICVDDYPGDKGFDPVEMPDRVDLRQTNRQELALAKYRVWEEEQELRIRFLDGTPDLHQRVEALARQWLDYANLGFNFGNFNW